ncbi:MAG: transporter [Gemmatimonadetes bacterium]|nr:MAG: transporter [Gemmatimonadota bacterium]
MTTPVESRVDVELDDDDVHELSAEQVRDPTAPGLWIYLLVGTLFGIVLTKGEAISWFRIQEMFRFQGFHMFGIFATALPTAIVGVQLLKQRWRRTLSGETVVIPPKHLGSGVRYAAGGTIFGLGWALTGACPGPLFALLGSGVTTMAVAIVSAMLGTWTYGRLRHRLPH